MRRISELQLDFPGLQHLEKQRRAVLVDPMRNGCKASVSRQDDGGNINLFGSIKVMKDLLPVK
jgi:hypothetical protein